MAKIKGVCIEIACFVHDETVLTIYILLIAITVSFYAYATTFTALNH